MFSYKMALLGAAVGSAKKSAMLLQKVWKIEEKTIAFWKWWKWKRKKNIEINDFLEVDREHSFSECAKQKKLKYPWHTKKLQ